MAHLAAVGFNPELFAPVAPPTLGPSGRIPGLLDRAHVDLQRLPQQSPQAYAHTTGFLNHTLHDIHGLRHPQFPGMLGQMFGNGMNPHALACMGGAMQQNPMMNMFSMLQMYQRQQQQFMTMMMAMAATNMFMQQMLQCLGQHGRQPAGGAPAQTPIAPAPAPPSNGNGAPQPGIDYKVAPQPPPNPNPPEDPQAAQMRAQANADRDSKYAPSGQEFQQQFQANFQKWSDASGGKKDLTLDDLDKLVKDPKMAYGEGGQALRATDLYLHRTKGDGPADSVSADGFVDGKTGQTTPMADSVKHSQGVSQAFRIEQGSDAFKQDMQRNFKAWDQKCGSKGFLTQADIDKLMQDPDIKGRDAVALSAMKGMEKGANGEKAELNFSPAGVKVCDRSNGTGQGKELQTIPWSSNKLGDLAGGPYEQSKEQLADASHQLFGAPDGMPHADAVRQGSNGDCYFISSAASLAQQNPQAIKNMIHDNNNGTYTVNFPGRRPVTVDKPTDAELAHYGTSGKDGTWLSVLEKGYGAVRQREGTTQKGDTLDNDGIEKYDGADGGLIGFKAMDVLTGHQSGDIPIHDKDGKFIAPNDIRDGIEQTLKQHRLIAAETPSKTEKTDKGQLLGHHEYQVLAYDRASDTITVRDPNGSKGPGTLGIPSFAQSSGKNDGVMTMKMSDFLRNFSGVSIETGQPLKDTDSGFSGAGGTDRQNPQRAAA